MMITAAALLAFSAAFGQDQWRDTTRTNNRTQGKEIEIDKPAPSTQPPAPPKQNRVMVPPNQIPSLMQQTLQGKEYRGWQNSTIYQDRATREYSLEIREGNATPRTYRFDRNGRVINGANSPVKETIDRQGAKDIDQ
mgnify:CR=1 FL=1